MKVLVCTALSLVRVWSAMRFKSMVCCRFFALETSFSWKCSWSFSSNGANVEGCQSMNDIPVRAVSLSGFRSVIDHLTRLSSASPPSCTAAATWSFYCGFLVLVLGFSLNCSILRVKTAEPEWAWPGICSAHRWCCWEATFSYLLLLIFSAAKYVNKFSNGV